MTSIIKKYFLAGILTLAPLAITMWVITWCLSILDSVFSTIVFILMKIIPGNSHFLLKSFIEIPGLGIFVVLAFIFFSGVFAINYAGRWSTKIWDHLIQQIPIFKSIYYSVKQVSDTLLSSKDNVFKQVVLIQYPHANSWVIAFVTGNSEKEIDEKMQTENLNVFVPTTPNPTSGFFIIVPKQKVIILNISIEDAVKHIVSMGSVSLLNNKNKKDII